MSTATTPSAITAAGLRKSYKDHVVLDGIDIDVPQGTVYSLLGPNGAGKTTAVQILSTLTRADGGRATVAGHSVADAAEAVRAAIGVTGQFSAIDPLLTGRENLILMADLHHLGKREGRRRADALLEQFDLVEAARRTPATYSGGMRRRLDLAMTLVGSPRVIFLDEPTTGLDPRSRRGMWQAIRGLLADGVTIFLTTQYLDEADELADKIAVLDGGRIVAEGTSAELKALIPGSHVRLQFAHMAGLDAASRAFRSSSRDDSSLTLSIPSDGSIASLRAVLDQLDSSTVRAEALTVHIPDLDDVFFALTGHGATVETAETTETTAPAAPAEPTEPTEPSEAEKEAVR